MRRHLLVARNLEPIYDNETAIRAFSIVNREYPEARLTIAGSGPLTEVLHTLAESLGLGKSVVFAGRLDKDKMAEAYRKADIAINPSLVDNMPNSVLEALASGVPVVSTNVGGVPFVVEHELTALLVPPKSPDEMAKAMLRLMHDSALSEKLVNSGLAEAGKYTCCRYGQCCPKSTAEQFTPNANLMTVFSLMRVTRKRAHSSPFKGEVRREMGHNLMHVAHQPYPVKAHQKFSEERGGTGQSHECEQHQLLPLCPEGNTLGAQGGGWVGDGTVFTALQQLIRRFSPHPHPSPSP